MKEMMKTYDPSAIEDRIYADWMEKNYFHAVVDHTKKPFTIMMPPPNITGQLHCGHALDCALQDCLIRFRRMQGFNALWQPGTDHASIATEVRIIAKLKEEGIPKETLGREGFLKRAWEWRKEYGGRIIEQMKHMGSSCDWERERFTMDEGCSKAVLDVFVQLYNEEKIYRGSRIINWCPVCHTSISDAEVEYKEQAGHFWHIKYPVIGSDEYLEFATTRPETMLGDTAVAVHPQDERYAHLVGKFVKLPFVDREIPIIADTYVERDFGTGVVKITPAHDPNDFEVGKRHNLPEINILNDDATINQNGGKFAGMDRYEARNQIVKELADVGLLVRIEDYTHNVGTHDRCGTTVEPMIKKQWFVAMTDLIKPAVNAVKTGEVELVPKSMEKLYYNWTDNIRDWCISRQLWWGHRIPAYYCDSCGEIVVAKTAPSCCPKCGKSAFTQDPDTLDTWFSSALWPFSTLGWPEKTEELEYFYPTDVLITAYDIIFFWVIRMIVSGYAHMGERPFKTVLLHGLVRDSQGRKMSKSLDNGIDPLEVIEKYGADALRFTLITGNAPGNDMRFYYERVEAGRNFANKVWNCARFILMNLSQMAEQGICPLMSSQKESILTDADRWILSKANSLVKDVTENLEKFELGIAAQKVYDFIWEEFCDWYIEMVKPRLYGTNIESKQEALFTLRTVLCTALKLLHPFMPFVTEEIYRTIRQAEQEIAEQFSMQEESAPMRTGEKESIMISEFPKTDEQYRYSAQEEAVELMKEAVKGIRNIRAQMNVPMSRKAKVIVFTTQERVRDIFENSKVFFESLAGAGEVVVQADKAGIDADAVSVVIAGATLYIPFAELVDLEKEKERLTRERERLQGELKRVNTMLSNANFIAKAPEAKLNEEKAKQTKYQDMLHQVEERLEHLMK